MPAASTPIPPPEPDSDIPFSDHGPQGNRPGFCPGIAARTGVVTGKGLSELVREEYGLCITFLLMAALVACNLGDVISEFVGVATGLELFGINKFISVPVASAFVWGLVVFGDYKRM